MKRLSLKRLLFEAGEDDKEKTKKDDKETSQDKGDKKPEEDKPEEDKPEEDKEKEGEETPEEGGDKKPDEAGGESDKSKEKEKEDVKLIPDELKPEDKSLEDSLGDELRKILIGFEQKSRKNPDELKKNENKKYSIRKWLLKEDKSDADTIDVDYFTSEVARLVKNYYNLIDMEALIVGFTQKFLLARYEPEVEREFISKLDSDYGIKINKPQKVSDEPLEQPIAVGARTSGGTT